MQNNPDLQVRTCETCGKEQVQQACVSFYVALVYTGHPLIAAFHCDAVGGQHWGCCAEHAIEAAVRCMKEELHPMLQQKQQEAHTAQGGGER